MGHLGNPDQFKDTPRPKKMGRPPGSPNKMGHTLMTLVMQAAEELGFLRKNGDGQLVEGEGGTLGYLKWIGINKPDRFVALMARVAPKHVFADVTHRAVSLTASEIEAELRDRGLPPELLDSLRNIPDDVLDWDEDPDPYRLKDVTPDAEGVLVPK